MSEQDEKAAAEAKADDKAGVKTASDVLAAFDAEAAALAVVEAPSLSPDTPAVEKAGADKADKPAEAKPEVAVVESPSIAPEGEAVTPAAAPNASQRFRAAAASQITAARERIAERNKSPVIAVALLAGLAGAGASTGLSAMVQNDRTQWESRAIADAIAKLDDSIVALRASVQQSAELAAAQTVATGERLAQIEKAQEKPTAQIIQLSEAIEKLRAANAAMVSRGPEGGEATGALKPTAGATAPVKMARRAIVEGWTLKDLDQDVALLEGKHGLFETTVGDIIPGVGRVEGFRKQDDRWVVVTARGLIVSR